MADGMNYGNAGWPTLTDRDELTPELARAWMDANPPRLAYLVEDILNDNVPNSPREATLARIAAGRARAAGDAAEVTRQLQLALTAVEKERPVNWRDALRANTELAIDLVSNGKFTEALPALTRSLELLDTRFSTTNLGGSELHYLLGFCGYATADFVGYAEHFDKSEELRARFPAQHQHYSILSMQALTMVGVHAYRKDVAHTLTEMFGPGVSDQCCGCGGCAEAEGKAGSAPDPRLVRAAEVAASEKQACFLDGCNDCRQEFGGKMRCDSV